MSDKMRVSVYARRRGFTLIELLVVISIIIVLATLLVPKLMSVQDNAKVAECKTLYANLAIALGEYEQKYGVYPGASASGSDDPKDDAPLMVKLLIEKLNFDFKVNQLGFGDNKGTDPLAEVYVKVATRNEVKTKLAANETVHLLDPWGQAIHFIEYGSRDDSKRSKPVTFDSGKVSHTAQNPEGFDLWSHGPNRRNDGGLSKDRKNDRDDVNNWD